MDRVSGTKGFIGFPPPLLGAEPLRVPVIAETSGWILLNKPSGIGLREHPWDIGTPNLDLALNKQLQAGKPELVRREAEVLASVFYLDPVISGAALFAKTRQSVADLRNTFGSSQVSFIFHFIATASTKGALEEETEVDAPLLPHRTKPKMIPSTAKGKKSRTRLQLLKRGPGPWALYRAECDYLRPHQVRAHAALLDLPVMGDEVYGGPPAPLLSDLFPKKRGPGIQFPVLTNPAIHLHALHFPGSASHIHSYQAPYPAAFQVALKRMDLEVPED